MRATKKRTDVIYNVLLKHFKVDEFLVRYSMSDKKIVICARKNTFVYYLEAYHKSEAYYKSIEFKWATKHIFTRCSSWPNLDIRSLSLEHFFYILKEVSWDFKLNRKSLIDIKHELVKQILSSMRQYWLIHLNAIEGNVPIYERNYTIDGIKSLEELVIQEELAVEVNKDNMPLI